jgi:N-acetylmuramoyl-L-alanine amidase/photosystem II stability/assembly factor-like uncharacterized protein
MNRFTTRTSRNISLFWMLILLAFLLFTFGSWHGTSVGAQTETENWTQIGLSGTSINTIAVDPSNPQIIYAASSTVGFGIYKTEDGGQSWNPVKAGLPGNVAVASLAIDPQDPQVLYVGTYTVGNSLFGGVYKSENGGEDTWVKILGRTNQSYFTGVAVDPTDSNVIYAIDGYYYSSNVHKSIDGGNTWTAKDNGMAAFAPIAIVIDPVDNQTLYVTSGDGIYKSTNSGEYWTSVSNGLPNGRIKTLAINPLNNQILYAGVRNIKGVYRSTDGGSSWSQMAEGLIDAWVEVIVLDPGDYDSLYIGTWKFLASGPASFGVYQTTDAAGSWVPANNGFPSDVSNLFIDTLAISPGTPRFLFAGTSDGVWVRTIGTEPIATVAIDPGHGQILRNGELVYQRSPSPTYGVIEDVVVLEIAKQVQNHLQQNGFQAILSRETELDPFAPENCGIPCYASTRARARWAERMNADILVSIHTNGSSNPTVHGTEAFYYSGAVSNTSEAKLLAQHLLDSLLAIGLEGTRGILAIDDDVSNVLVTTIPSALTEVAYHSNSQFGHHQTRQEDLDEYKLNDLDFKSTSAVAIANAIMDYYGVR